MQEKLSNPGGPDLWELRGYSTNLLHLKSGSIVYIPLEWLEIKAKIERKKEFSMKVAKGKFTSVRICIYIFIYSSPGGFKLV